MAKAKSDVDEANGEVNVDHKSAAAAIVAVMKEISLIVKRQPKEKGLRYAYLAEEDLVSELHPLFVKHGICIVPNDWFLLHNEIYPSNEGRPMALVRIKGLYTIHHADSGSSVPCAGMGEASDVADKAIPKAQTIAYKYALRQTFLLQAGNDPDLEQNKDRAPQNAAPPKSKAAGMDKGKLSPEEIETRFQAAREAVAKASNQAELDKMKRVYKTRPFSAEQLKVLDAAYDARKIEIEKPKTETPKQSSAEPSGQADDDGGVL